MRAICWQLGDPGAGRIHRPHRPPTATRRSFAPEAEWLSDAETLSYLHSCVSTKRHAVRVPETPMHLDAILVDEPLTGGRSPDSGLAFAVLTIMGFPSATHPACSTNSIASPFPIAGRRGPITLDKTDATKVLTRIRRQWFAKRKSVFAILKEVMTNEASALLDTDAHNKAMDADAALQDLGSDLIGEAYVTATLTVWDEDRASPTRNCASPKKSSRGATLPL